MFQGKGDVPTAAPPGLGAVREGAASLGLGLLSGQLSDPTAESPEPLGATHGFHPGLPWVQVLSSAVQTQTLPSCESCPTAGESEVMRTGLFDPGGDSVWPGGVGEHDGGGVSLGPCQARGTGAGS